MYLLGCGDFFAAVFSRLVRMKKAVIMKLSRQSALNLFYHHYIHIKNAKRAYSGCSVSIFPGVQHRWAVRFMTAGLPEFNLFGTRE